MTCTDCTAAAQGPHWGFKRACPGCEARAISRGPDFHRCRTAGKQDGQYRELLTKVGVTHAEVVAAAEVDKERATA
ncbi:MAG: hypothetical protein EOP39_04350 [Rubrivivax sp.]|nr:MAG: hypothetical protein EOP39_04350 [Rubrivivax sp.]